MVATAALEDVQYPDCVTSCVVPSLKVPSAMKFWVVPSAMPADPGLMVIDTSTACVTVSIVDPLIAPEVAVMFAVPLPALEASPALLMVAVDGVSDDQAAVAVRSIVLLSVNEPVALNCCVVPSPIEGLAGAIVIETSAAAVTVIVVEPVTLPLVALIVAVPVPEAVTRPGVPPKLISAVEGAPELHCTVCVRFCVLVSLKVPVAVNCCEAPSEMVGMAGVTVIETSTAGVTVTTVEPEIAPEEATTLLLPTAALLTRP